MKSGECDEGDHNWFRVPDYIDTCKPRILRNEGAIAWEIRKNSAALTKSGVLILGAGRRGHLIHRTFEKVAVELLAAEALGARP